MDEEHAKTVDLLLRCYRAAKRRKREDYENIADLLPVIESRLAELFGDDWKSDWFAASQNNVADERF